MRIINKTGRRLGIGGPPSIILEAGSSALVDDEHYRAIYGRKQFKDWLEHGLVEVEEAHKEKPPKPIGVDIVHRGGGWYRVHVNGVDVSQENQRKADAEALAGNYQ